MITNNTNKKQLVEKLLENKNITLDEAFTLLDEPVSTKEYIPYPQPCTWPNLPGLGWPYSPTVLWGADFGTTTLPANNTVTSITTTDVYNNLYFDAMTYTVN